MNASYKIIFMLTLTEGNAELIMAERNEYGISMRKSQKLLKKSLFYRLYKKQSKSTSTSVHKIITNSIKQDDPDRIHLNSAHKWDLGMLNSRNTGQEGCFLYLPL